MVDGYERALQELHRAPLDKFIAERDRISAALRASGDKTGAAKVAIRRRPTISVWAVNQLYWRDPKAIERLFVLGERVRKAQTGQIRNADLRSLIDETK